MSLSVRFVSALIIMSCLHLPAYAEESLTSSALREYNAENYEEAVELLNKLKARGPSSDVSYYLGVSLKQAGDPKAAAENLRDAIRLSPPVPEAYTELIEVLYTGNEFVEASEWITKAEGSGINPPRVAFLKGLVLSKTQRYKEAIESFRNAKRLDPGLTQTADLQIALLYAREMKFAEAKESLQAVIAVDPSSEIASFAREYETAIRDAGRQRAWRFSAGVSYQYDDNVVLKPSDAVPGVIITGERDSGLIGTFRADYSPMTSGPWFFNSRFMLYTSSYFHTSSHNIIAPSVLLNPGVNLGAGAASLPLSFSYSWLDGRRYERVLSVKPTFTRILGPGHIGQVQAGYSRRDILQPLLDADENRDGGIFSLAASYIRTFSSEKGVVNIRYEFLSDDTKGKNWDSSGNRLDFSALLPAGANTSISLAGGAFIQDYRTVHTVFAAKRKDRTYSGSAGILWEVLKAVNVNLQYSHTRAKSNIAIYDYNRNIYTVGAEYRF
ncbi:MAG: tetratricopeptide repeat protein [Nitrospirae bacterium]|nr:tetratricopeptide repeat protein [Nitrospirota bacterium]